jgi:hypothetical protein
MIYNLLNQGTIVIDVTNYVFGKVNNQMNFNFVWKDFQIKMVVRSWNLQTNLKYPYCKNNILGEIEIIMTCSDDHLDRI